LFTQWFLPLLNNDDLILVQKLSAAGFLEQGFVGIVQRIVLLLNSVLAGAVSWFSWEVR
jgi:hypothetical protein